MLDQHGQLLDSINAAQGIRQIANQQFLSSLRASLCPWLDKKLPILAAAMIGSRDGLFEMPYMSCPCQLTELSQQLHHIEFDQYALYLVAGCKLDTPHKFDVMRGEETQLLGAQQLLQKDAVVCIPGTHSKWALVKQGQLQDFTTYLTGELYTVLRQHSILGQGQALDNADAFKLGLQQAKQQPNELLSNLFTTRGHLLQQQLHADDTASYLSGLLIGHELLSAATRYQNTPMMLIADDAITAHYQQAAMHYDLNLTTLPAEKASVAGLFTIARLAGLIEGDNT